LHYQADAAARPAQEQDQGWSELWDSNESDLWDRGKPSPALVDFIEKVAEERGLLARRLDGGRLKALIPVS